MQFRGVALIASKATYLYIRVSLTIKKFKTSSSTFTEILFKHHLVEFMKKNCKVMVKKQCKRAKTIFRLPKAENGPDWQPISKTQSSDSAIAFIRLYVCGALYQSTLRG